MKSITSEKIRENAKLSKDDDKFRYYNLAGYLLDYILSKNLPISVGIYGKWGSGKTVLANFMEDIANERNEKEKDGLNLIKFFKFDVASFKNSEKDIFWYFISSIAPKNDLKSILKKAWGSKKNFLWLIIKAIANKYIGSDGASIIDNYIDNKKLREDIIRSIEKNNRSSKNIIVIDNLDRLQPAETVTFLEQLKSFLLTNGDNVLKNYAYVILCDFDIISKEIYKIYNNQIDVRDYLNKIIEVPFYLPSYKSDRADSFVKTLLNKDIPELVANNICKALDRFGIKTPRDLKNFLLELDMIFIMAKARGQEEKYLIENLDKLLVLQILKAKYFDIFYYISSNIETLCDKGTKLFEYKRLLSMYERSVSSGGFRNIDEILASRDTDDIKLIKDIKLVFDVLGQFGLINYDSREGFLCLNEGVKKIIQMIDDVNINYAVNVNDFVNLSDEIIISK